MSSIYGDALFELALEENKMDSLFEEIADVREVFSQNEELLKLFDHPKIVKEEKLALVENVFQGRVSDYVLGFLHIIVEKDRYHDMLAIFDHFLHRVKIHKGIGSASVTSAIPLSEEQKTSIEKRLLEVTNYKTIEMDYSVNTAILGGLVIRMDDRVVDSSLKTQMDTLCRQLSKIQLS